MKDRRKPVRIRREQRQKTWNAYIINVSMRERFGDRDPENEMHKRLSLTCRGNFF